jgi:5-enolpyruvylshikimate-3-phosphate synthase
MNAEIIIAGPRPLRGTLRVPGDKGISHRALLAAALASGSSTIRGLADGDDVLRTRAALERLGVRLAVSKTAEPDRGAATRGRRCARCQDSWRGGRS